MASERPTFQEPGWFTRNVFNRVVAALARLGLSVAGSRVLRVRGRTSGAWRETPVNLLTLEGTRYLVAPRGGVRRGPHHATAARAGAAGRGDAGHAERPADADRHRRGALPAGPGVGYGRAPRARAGDVQRLLGAGNGGGAAGGGRGGHLRGLRRARRLRRAPHRRLAPPRPDSPPARPGARLAGLAGRPVRARVHRRRQAELRQLLRGRAAQAGGPRPDRRRQHAVERPGGG